MNSIEIFIIVGFIFTILIFLSGISTFINSFKVRKITDFLLTQDYTKFYSKNCYYSAIGFKKHYPSYPSKMEIYLTDNEILFIGKKAFPFIFTTIEIPFALSKDPNKTKSALEIPRIFKPLKFDVSEKRINFEFVDNIAFHTHINYQIDILTSTDWEKLKISSDW